jgi:TonB family protein
VDAASATRLPRLLDRPSDDEMRDAYPEEARKKGLDADVGLEILVDDTGRVARVRVSRPAGSGFDEAAARLVRRHRFRPADKGGRPVAVWIPWTYKFRLGE